jgi:MFS family permease
MEEQVITNNQYKTFKFVRGWLMGLFVLIIIGGAGSVIGLITAFAISAAYVHLTPQITSSLLSFIPIVIESIMLGALLFTKGPNRKNFVSTTMLVYASISAAFSLINLALGNPSSVMNAENSLYSSFIPTISSIAAGIAFIFTAVCSAIFLFLSILLFRKTRQMQNREFPNKLLFIIYIVVMFASLYTIVTLVFPFNIIAGYVGIVITIYIVVGFFTFMSLFPLISLYKALDDEIFYERFIAVHPDIAISRYDAVMFRLTVKSEPARYCVNCGTPLEPGAAFCRECGHKVGDKAKNNEN